MGIAGCRVLEQFFVDYLGMRAEYIDMRMRSTAVSRTASTTTRSTRPVLPGAPSFHHRENCNLEAKPLHLGGVRRAKPDYCIKTLLIDATSWRQPLLAELGFAEEAEATTPSRRGLPGAASVDGLQAQRRHPGASSSTPPFTGNGKRPEKVFATEGDAGNAVWLCSSTLS